jgi:hypothetical protein
MRFPIRFEEAFPREESGEEQPRDPRRFGLLYGMALPVPTLEPIQCGDHFKGELLEFAFLANGEASANKLCPAELG